MARFLGIDLGTSAVKCLVMDEKGNVLAQSRRANSRICTSPGYIEQNPLDWWNGASEAIMECLNKIGSGEITAVSLSGHMSAPVLLDSAGSPVRNSILIADTRSAEETAELKDKYSAEFWESAGNLPIDAFTAPKLLWLIKNEPELCEKIHKVVFPKDYIRLKLTGETATDHTDAGNSLLYDLASRAWNFPMIKKLGLPDYWFPRIEEAFSLCGRVTQAAAKQTGLAPGTPVICGAADMACSQLGSGGFSPEAVAITLSTSIQVVTPVETPVNGLRGKLTFHQSAVAGNSYAMSSIFSGSMSVDWLYKLLNGKDRKTSEDYLHLNNAIIRRYKEAPINGVLFLPFLTGSGSPWFNSHDTGAFLGLTPDVTEQDLFLSVFEGISFNIRENMELIEQYLGAGKRIYLAGGGAQHPAWPEILAGVTGHPVHLLRQKDAATMGAVILAGVGIGEFENPGDCFRAWNGTEHIVEPEARHEAHYNEKYTFYRHVYNSIKVK